MPVGSNVPLVIQVGKWRKAYQVNVAACQNNAQPDKSIAFPSTVAAGNTDDNIPDIAVSTGGADTLECLMLRIGISSSEYVAGPGSGHVHIYAGGDPSGFSLGGQPEQPPMAGAPESDTSLWSSQAQLMPYDIVLLSCEGGETYNANPAVLESYLNAGGRAFGSHFHYAWFSGPLESFQSYHAPADWSNLATWTIDKGSDNLIGGIIDQTLNGSSNPFPKGVALQKWLAGVGGLGKGSPAVPATELSIYQPRYNATVSASNTPSQPWITADPSSSAAGSTMYFSFDTPIMTAPPPPDGTGPTYCGRAVFSDLHVAGDPSTTDSSPPRAEQLRRDRLSPQEKALEFHAVHRSVVVRDPRHHGATRRRRPSEHAAVVPISHCPPDFGGGRRRFHQRNQARSEEAVGTGVGMHVDGMHPQRLGGLPADGAGEIGEADLRLRARATDLSRRPREEILAATRDQEGQESDDEPAAFCRHPVAHLRQVSARLGPAGLVLRSVHLLVPARRRGGDARPLDAIAGQGPEAQAARLGGLVVPEPPAAIEDPVVQEGLPRPPLLALHRVVEDHFMA